MAEQHPASPLSASLPLPPEVMPDVLTDGTPWPADAIEVGKVVDAWGIKGGIKVAPFSSDPQALFGAKRWFVLPPLLLAVARPRAAAAPSRVGAPMAGLAGPSALKVKTAKEQGDVIVATVDGIEDRNAAEALKGVRIFVSRSAFPAPDEDEYYWIDLIGLDVLTPQGQALGRVMGLLETGPHCVLRCQPADVDGQPSPERLIPFVGAYIQRVSLAERVIVADWGFDY
jgi:16S rRNA processing protein RimM